MIAMGVSNSLSGMASQAGRKAPTKSNLEMGVVVNSGHSSVSPHNRSVKH